MTGLNTGLGLGVARHFARLRSAKVVLAVHTVSKGEQPKESILESTKRTSDCVEVWVLDPATTASAMAVVARGAGSR